MISEQETSQQKFEIIQIDDQLDEDQQINNKPMQTHPLNKPLTSNHSTNPLQHPVQINSLQSFTRNLQSPQKRHPFPTSTTIPKQNSPPHQSQHQVNQQITSEFRSLNSMNQSQIEFINYNRLDQKSIVDNDSMIQDDGWKGNSPEKLIKRRFESGKVSRGGARVSLVSPDMERMGRCYWLLDETCERLDKFQGGMKAVHQFLHQPLPAIKSEDYMRYVFEIHFYKFQFTFHTYFQFYLRNSSGQMVHILKSQKDGLSVSSSHLLYAVHPHDVNKKEFAAKLKYNTLKTEYNLYNIDEKGQKQKQKNTPRQLLATAFYDKKFNEQRQLSMYVPKYDYREDKFIKSSESNNLAAFYNQSQGSLTRKVEKLQTIPTAKETQEQIKEQFSLKNSGRKLLLVNEQKVEKFYMGKRQDDRYIIVAAAGMTPLQVFMLGVVNLEH